jgi:uncharacterized RDD family membrane protein YckC
VSGRPPFIADSVDQLITLHATAARPSVPRGANPRTMITAIDALIARMMAPDPKDRFGSYDELLRAVELASVQHTRPAGFWVRSIAVFVDFLLVLLAIVLVQGAAELAAGRSKTEASDLVILPFAMLYATLAVRRWGTTAGKALFELEVVSIATSQRPSWSQSFRRVLYVVAIPLLCEVGDLLRARLKLPIPHSLFEFLGVSTIVILGVTAWHAALRVPGKRTPWDRFAGTMVRYRTTRGSAGAVP